MKYVYFPRWAEVLNNTRIDPAAKSSYECRIGHFLRWCAVEKCFVTHESARKFVLELEDSMIGDEVEAYREAIRWFFRN